MQIFGMTIARTKALQLASVESRSGWWPWSLVRESFAGAWQQNVEISLANVLTHPTVFACVTLIASDIAKMGFRLVELDDNGIWTPRENPAFSPLFRKPNRYQTRIKFVQTWQISRLVFGNTYVLKQRDRRGIVIGLYVLDPQRVRPLVASNGDVYYEVKRDDLSGVRNDLVGELAVPANEIIHDVMYPLYHPLVGVGPIHAAGLASVVGLKIQTNSAQFFANGSSPGGVLTAPGAISDATALRLKAYWETNYTGDNVGKVAVLGDGLKYEPMAVKAVDAQLTEQWEATAKAICSAYHVPAYKVGVGAEPTHANAEIRERGYYAQALQEPIESMELLWDEGIGLGLGFGNRYGSEFDLDDLLRMDTATQITALKEAVIGALISPNAAGKKLNQPPVPGGDTRYLQQQNYSLEALDKRDKAGPPLATPPVRQLPAASADEDDEDVDDADLEARFLDAMYVKAIDAGLPMEIRES